MKTAFLTMAPPSALILAGIFAYGFLPTALMPVYPEGSAETQEAHVLAGSLVKAQERNSTRFELEHAGDIVRASGKVGKIHERNLVELKSRWGHTLYCIFSDPAEAARLEPGERIELSGTVREARRTGTITAMALLEGCSARKG